MKLGLTFNTLFPEMTPDQEILISQTNDGFDNAISRTLFNHLPGKTLDGTIDYHNGSVYRGTIKALDLLDEGHFLLRCDHTMVVTGASVVGYDCVVNALVPAQ